VSEPLALWCVECQATHETVARLLAADITLYRCGCCGNWVRCPICRAVRSAEHVCVEGVW
jgi:hypothetical protein